MTDFFQLLSKIKSLEYSSISRSESGWNASGIGNVNSEFLAENVLKFSEQGESTLISGAKIKFSNIYRWTKLNDQQILLEHLRQGAPTRLLTLDSMSELEWASQDPHICGKDTYSVEAKIDSGTSFKLKWIVRGESKDEEVQYSYSY